MFRQRRADRYRRARNKLAENHAAKECLAVKSISRLGLGRKLLIELQGNRRQECALQRDIGCPQGEAVGGKSRPSRQNQIHRPSQSRPRTRASLPACRSPSRAGIASASLYGALRRGCPALGPTRHLRTCTLIPGLSSGFPVNSMPAASSAVLISTKLEVRLGGIPSKASYRFIVRALTPDLAANSSIDQPAAARAERI